MTNHKSKARELLNRACIRGRYCTPSGCGTTCQEREEVEDSIASALREAEISGERKGRLEGARKMREKVADFIQGDFKKYHEEHCKQNQCIACKWAKAVRSLSPESVLEG